MQYEKYVFLIINIKFTFYFLQINNLATKMKSSIYMYVGRQFYRKEIYKI